MARIQAALAALCLSASVLLVPSATAQDSPSAPGSAGSAQPAAAASPTAGPLDTAGFQLPALDSITEGGRTIDSGTTHAGAVAVRNGDLEIRGEVTGDAVAVDGDVIVREGGLVRGDAIAVRGLVRLAGGSVLGEILTTSTEPEGGAAPLIPARDPAAATRHALSLAFGWLAVIAVIGIGVLIFAGDYLDGTAAALERRFSRAFWFGIAGQLAILPVLVVLITGLAITLIGILLIPFAVVAYMIAVAGLLTLGFLAVARVTGAALTRPAGPDRTPRAALLRSLAIGVMVYMGFWIAAAAFAWSSVMFMALTGIAFIITWVAVTAGLGAAILSRAGTRSVGAPDDTPSAPEEVGWQTPTPIGGVVAARRPTPRVKEPR